MKLSFWMITKAVVETFFGIGFVLVPAMVVSMYGGGLSLAARTFVQLGGAVFLASAIILWRSRHESPDNPILHSIIIATVFSNGIGLVVALMAVLSGGWNVLGWSGVVLNLAFFLGFGPFLVKKPA